MQIQLEAIATELSFFLVEDVPAKKRVGLLVEVRNAGAGRGGFRAGSAGGVAAPGAAGTRRMRCSKAMDDDTRRCASKRSTRSATIARPPLAADAAAQLIKALDHYDPGDPRRGRPRDRPARRSKSAGDALIKAMNDSNSARAICGDARAR